MPEQKHPAKAARPGQAAAGNKPARGAKPPYRGDKAQPARGPKPPYRGDREQPAREQRPPYRADREKPAAAEPAREDIICGRNAVLEMLRSEQSINKVWLAEGIEASFSGAVFSLCKQRGVPCHQLPKHKLERLAGAGNQGVAAELAAFSYVEIDDLLAAAAARGEEPFFVLLDGVEDPHNLGAVMRSALSAGAQGLIIGRHRAAQVNQTVIKTSAGAAAYLPVARVANLNQALQQLQQAGCWAVAADMDGQPYYQANLTGPVVLVLGSEGQGIAPLLKKNCDFVVSMPMRGEVSSLNVSAAAAVLLYEVVRQRSLL